jgi:hypothetical protein
MKSIAFGLIALLLVVAVLTSGCVANLPNPFSASKSDYSANLERSLSGAGWTPIHPISQVTDNVYSGSYKASSGNSSGNGSATLAVTIEIAQSEDAAKDRYGQLVLEKQKEGYTSGNSELGTSTVLGDPKASWFGYREDSLASAPPYTFFYACNTEIGKWVVVTESGGTANKT